MSCDWIPKRTEFNHLCFRCKFATKNKCPDTQNNIRCKKYNKIMSLWENKSECKGYKEMG